MNGFVVKEGLIFRAGSYPEVGLEMTPAEVKAMATKFKKPVPIDLNHKTTLRGLDSKLGHLSAVSADDNGNLFGKIEIPEWLNNLVGKDENGNDIPIKVSSTIHKAEKELLKLALTDNPRVNDAAVFAAFSEANPEELIKFTMAVWSARPLSKTCP